MCTLSSEASREFGMEVHMLVRLPSLLRGWLNEGRYSEEWCTAAGVERERESGSVMCV